MTIDFYTDPDTVNIDAERPLSLSINTICILSICEILIIKRPTYIHASSRNFGIKICYEMIPKLAHMFVHRKGINFNQYSTRGAF